MQITMDIYSHVLPGLQEAAAEKFDRIFDGDSSNIRNENVSKMLANGDNKEGGSGEIDSGAGGIRTLYLLTASL